MSGADRSSSGKVQSTRTQLADVVQFLKLDLAMWRRCHKSGWHMLKTLLQLQAKCMAYESDFSKLKTKRQLDAEADKLRRLQRDRKSACDNLRKVIVRLGIANDRMRASLKLLRQLAKDRTLCHFVFYRSWPLVDILKFAECMMRLCDAEYEIKEMVAEDVLAVKTHEALRTFRLLWRFPRHALTTEFNTMFENFINETKT